MRVFHTVISGENVYQIALHQIATRGLSGLIFLKYNGKMVPYKSFPVCAIDAPLSAISRSSCRKKKESKNGRRIKKKITVNTMSHLHGRNADSAGPRSMGIDTRFS
jgi:hypothetical protein